MTGFYRLSGGLLTKRFPVVLVSCCSLFSCTADEGASDTGSRDHPVDSSARHTIAAEFTAIAKNAVSDRTVEGIQFSIIEDGEILLAQALGLADRETGRPMTVDTPINVASISKPVTAWGILALAERRNLDLDTQVCDLMAGSPICANILSGYAVSIRMLLAHTSGLSGSSVPVIPATKSLPDATDVLLGKSSVPAAVISGRPGTAFRYSGAGYLILQEIIEDQTGSDFAQYMATTVLGPGKMSGSTFALTPASLDHVAVYYRGDGRRRNPYHLPGAAGGLYSTAIDMAQFVMMYTDAGYSTRRQIISDDGFSTLLAPAVDVEVSSPPIAGIQYALGHYTYLTPEGSRIVYHSGGNPGLRAVFIVALDRNIGFFAVVNNDRGSEILPKMMSSWSEHHGLTLRPYF